MTSSSPRPGSDGNVSLLADAFVRLPDPIVMVGSTGEVAWGNRAAERLFRVKLEDWVGRSSLAMVHPDDHELVFRSLASIQDKDVGTTIEIRVKTPGGWRLVEIIGTTVRWTGEQVVLLCLRDLTDRRRFELATGREARFRSLVHNAGSVIMLVSPLGTIESVSGAITRLLGHDPELLEHRPLVEIVAEADRVRMATALSAASHHAASAHPVRARVELLRHDGGDPVPFELSIVDLLDDPTVEGYVISAHDASSQVRAERDLTRTLSMLTATLDSTADGILVVSSEGIITGCNRRFAQIWQIPEDAVSIGASASSLNFALDQLSFPDSFTALETKLLEAPETESLDILEFKDGRVVERLARPQRVHGKVVGRVLSHRDVTERARLEVELTYQAFHDSLTGLANKALFQDRLEHALARIKQTGSHLAVLFIDLDDFKMVNDSLGHGEGDLLLKRVASTLVECLRPLDTAARLGGDEFAVLIEDVATRDDITAVARRILDTLRPPIELGTKSVSAAASIGIAYDDPGITSDQLLRNADIAMYQAKELGKDRYEVYRQEMHALVVARVELEEELRDAIEQGSLIAHYQPIVDLATRRPVGFEALVRWPHPRGGLVDPRLFVPIAERLGIISEIDLSVLRTACRQARRWHQEHPGSERLVMSINLSAGQLIEPTLGARIAAAITECDFDPRSLILEITESAVLTDNDATLRNLSELRSMGVRIALDDFGTGYSSFSHLDRLQVDIVKIDRSFVGTLVRGDDGRSLAAAMIQLARTLGYATIAEGVENAEQAEALRGLGCGLAQGYHLGHPLDAEQTGRLVAASSLDPQGRA